MTTPDSPFPTELALAQIGINPSFNPRRHFDENELQELADDVRERGVLQSVLVRPVDGEPGFELVAGERRYRAAQIAGLATIPVNVRRLNASEALAAAVAENLVRADMAPSEEARAARRILGLVEADREEAARTLGWSRKKLDARLLLLHCSEAVLSALDQRQIQLSHAELLAGLPAALQDDSLKSIVDNGVGVAQLRDSIGRYAYHLDSACFDTEGCARCPHNSEPTADLFGESLGTGHCLNRECYEGKVKAHLEQVKADASERFNCVFLDIESDQATRTFLLREGDQGVGSEQHSQCLNCTKFGALVRSDKGREGELEEGLCFDIACHQAKVSAHRAAVAPAKTSRTAGGEKGSSAATAKPPAKQSQAASGKSSKPTKRAREFASALHLRAAGDEVTASPVLARVFGLLALHHEVGTLAKDSPLAASCKQLGAECLLKAGQQDHALVPLLSALPVDGLDRLIAVFAGAMAAGASRSSYGEDESKLKRAQAAFTTAQADLRDYFTLSKAYLETLTVAGIEGMLAEAGFDAWMDERDGKGSFRKWLGGKKRGELIEAVLASEFDSRGFVPKALTF